jgi:hypothetical protein
MGSKMAVWMDGKFRDAIHKRDGWKCRICERDLGRGPHDALPVLGKVANLPGEGLWGKARTFDINHQPENLMTLCLPCQKKNTSRLIADRHHGVKRLRMDGRTHDRIVNEAIRRGVDVEAVLVQMLDDLKIPGESGITRSVYLPDGTIKPGTPGGGERKAWVLEQKPRPTADRGPVPVAPVEERMPVIAAPGTPSEDNKCPKCGTNVEFVVPPIPGAEPFYQCEDGECNWMSTD